jgi:ATP-binding cassette, subfamily C, bacterial
MTVLTPDRPKDADPAPATEQPARRRYSTKRVAIQFIKTYLSFVSNRKGAYALLLVVSSSILEGFGLLAMVPLLAIIGKNQLGTDNRLVKAADACFAALHVHGTEAQLIVMVGFFATMGVLRVLLTSQRSLAVADLQMRYGTQEMISVVRLLATAPWQKTARLQHARINYLFSSDIGNIIGAGSVLIGVAVTSIMLVSQAVVAFILSPMMTLFSFTLIIGGTVAMYPLLRRAKELGETTADIHIKMLHDTGQFLSALKLAIGQNLQSKFVNMFYSSINELNRQNILFIRRQRGNSVKVTTVGMAIACVTAAVGIGWFHVEPVVLVTLLLVFTRMSTPAQQLQSYALSFVGMLPAYVKLQDLRRDLSGGEANPAAGGTDLVFRRGITFRDVGYIHQSEAEDETHISGLRGLDLKIDKGDLLGIAGSSGAGKTTFADLLVGLYTPQAGKILIDGVETDISADLSWRDHLAYVSQDSVMFNETLRASLLWSNEAATETEIVEALALSGADTIVARLPEGLSTVAGERGTLISGGERQRFAIARALLRKPKLLILDEATNAIDIKGERILLERLNALRPELTIVLIAHRVETLSLCNRVVIMGRGQVTAQGSFDELHSQLVAI